MPSQTIFDFLSQGHNKLLGILEYVLGRRRPATNQSAADWFVRRPNDQAGK